MYCVLCYSYFIQEETEAEGSVKAMPVHESQAIESPESHLPDSTGC